MSALPLETPEATVPIPASATSFTDTLALGLTCLFIMLKNPSPRIKAILLAKEQGIMVNSPDEGRKLIGQDPQ